MKSVLRRVTGIFLILSIIVLGFSSNVFAEGYKVGTFDGRIFVGSFSKALIDNNHNLLIWGDKGHDQVNNTSLYDDKPTKTLENVLDYSPGLDSSYVSRAAIKTDHTLWIWGDGETTKLDDTHSAANYVPRQIDTDVVKVKMGSNLGSYLKSDGSYYVFGSFLVKDPSTGSYSPQLVQTPFKVADNVKDFDGSRYLTNDGVLYETDGNLKNGSLEYTKITDNVKNIDYGIIKNDDTYWELNYDSTAQKYVPSLVTDNVKQVVDALILKKDGKIYRNEYDWENRTFHMVAYDSNVNKLIPGYHYLKNDDTFWKLESQATSDGHFKSVPKEILPGKQVVSLAGSPYDGLAVTSQGDVYTWGTNQCGQIGNGTHSEGSNPYEHLVDPTLIMSGLKPFSLVEPEPTPEPDKPVSDKDEFGNFIAYNPLVFKNGNQQEVIRIQVSKDDLTRVNITDFSATIKKEGETTSQPIVEYYALDPSGSVGTYGFYSYSQHYSIPMIGYNGAGGDLGKYTITLSYKNSDGKTTSFDRTVTIMDPTVKAIKDLTINGKSIKPGSSYSPSGTYMPTVEDVANIEVPTNKELKVEYVLDPANAQTHQVSWKLTNAWGMGYAAAKINPETGLITFTDAPNQNDILKVTATIDGLTYDGYFHPVSKEQPTNNYSVKYRAHVENIGWQNFVTDGAQAGTTGQGLRLEGLEIDITDANGNPTSNLGVSYRAHVQDLGWQDWVSDLQVAGTVGESKKIEAIQIKLTGPDADKYDIFYYTHCQDDPDLQWTLNGDTAGTEGFNRRLEMLQIGIYRKNDPNAPQTKGHSFHSAYGLGSLRYGGHVQEIGWQDFVADGNECGTTGRNLKLEALTIAPNPALPSGEVICQAHVEDFGWMPQVSTGRSTATIGTTGLNKRMEAIRLNLTGELANNYDIYYKAHVQEIGWQDWVKNGEDAGTTGQGLKVEAIRIVLVPKGSTPPQY